MINNIPDVGVHIINMDTAVHEQIVLNDDGSFSIFLNARLNREAQIVAYNHALHHILNDDFYKSNVDSTLVAPVQLLLSPLQRGA